MKISPIKTVAIASIALAMAMGTAHAQTFPLTIDNCGHELSFDKPPTSIVTIGQATTEAMYRLGLGDKVAGTAVWFTPVLPEYEAVNAKTPRIADNAPSFEAVVSRRPQLVASEYEWYVGPKGSVATREQFHDVGVATYIWPADCIGKDNSVGIDGTREALISTDTIYQGLLELAQIFGVAAAGEEAVAELKAREATAIAQAQSLNLTDTTAVFWFSSREVDADPFVAGTKGVPAFMMQQLGIKNIVGASEEWPTVGWETIAKANPDYIVLADLARRKFPADAIEVKMAFLQEDPVASQMDAVKNGRILVMGADSMNATIRTISGLELLAEALAQRASVAQQ